MVLIITEWIRTSTCDAANDNVHVQQMDCLNFITPRYVYLNTVDKPSTASIMVSIHNTFTRLRAGLLVWIFGKSFGKRTSSLTVNDQSTLPIRKLTTEL